jgi:hypothetical protein
MNNPYILRTYHINQHQLDILEHIRNLPTKNLHYITGQQSNKHLNLTLPELKKLIKRGIRQYLQPYLTYTPNKKESDLIRFVCVFETTKDFFHSQHKNIEVSEDLFLGLHFHLFISPSPTNYWVSFPSLVHSIFSELTSIKHKARCISKFDYTKFEELDENFILYHTKQFMYRPAREMIMSNY